MEYAIFWSLDRVLIFLHSTGSNYNSKNLSIQKKNPHYQNVSVAGNRTRVSWVKARYPNRWTTTDLLMDKAKLNLPYV